MTIEHFGELLKGNNGIAITKELVIYNDFELYNYKTEESKCYESLRALVDDNPDVKKIIEDAEAFYLDWDGGRGSGSGGGGGGVMGGGFNHAPDNFGNGDQESRRRLYPAELNYGTAGGNSVDDVLARFQKKYADARSEYGITVDRLGYVNQHVGGNATSVSISGAAGETLIHNHPGGGNFSDSDLHNFARTDIKSIIATSSNTKNKSTFRIEKTAKFKAKEFDKAMAKAKWDVTKYNYDGGADWWLKKNQKTYGYKYTSTGLKNAGKASGR